MSPPRISIITVCYNSESTIEKTLQSVKNQDYPNTEYIVVDGKSTDRTLNILSRYKDIITQMVSGKDDGIPDALNKGIAMTTGEWIYFLNSDDVFYSNHTLSNVFTREYDADMVYGDVIMKKSGHSYDGEFDLSKLLTRNICHQAQFYRKTIFSTVGMFNTRYRFLSDYDHTLRIFASSARHIHIGEIIAVFNDSGRTALHLDKLFWKDRRRNFIKRFRGRLPVKELARAYEFYFYYCFKTASILKGLVVLTELVFYTRRLNYVSAAMKNLYQYYRNR